MELIRNKLLLIVIFVQLQMALGLVLDIDLQEDNQSLERSGNNSETSKTFDFDKDNDKETKPFFSIDDIQVDYPEIKPGRPITAYLIIGLAFVTMTITPYLLYSLYLLVTPSPLRHHILGRQRTRRSARLGTQFNHFDPPSWYESNDINSIHQQAGKSECLEKIFCRISKRAHNYGVGSWVNSAAESVAYIRPSWRVRMHRGMSFAAGPCNFHCDLLNSMLTDVKNLIASRDNEDTSNKYLESHY